MAYTWLTYDTQTGALGKHSQTGSPMIQTTTVTIGTDAPKVNTTSTTTLTASTTTTTSTDAEGIITTTTVTIAFDPNLIHPNQAIIGAFDGVTVVMTSAEQAAYDNPQAYLYQSGAFVANPNWASMELAQAARAQVTAIEQGYAQALNGGFTSSASGTALAYASDTVALTELGWVRGLTSSTYPTTGLEARLSDGTFVILDYDQMQTLITDSQTFFLAQRGQKVALVKQVQAATTVSAVQTITWSTTA